MKRCHRWTVGMLSMVLLLSLAPALSAAKPPKKAAPPAKQAPLLLLTDVRNYGSPRAGQIGMAGIATNRSRQPLRNVMAVIVHTNDAGKIIEQKSLLAFRLLKPNAPQKFNVKVDLSPKERHGKYLIGFGLADGQALDVQVRKAKQIG